MNFDPDPQNDAFGEELTTIRLDMQRLLATARSPDACGIVLWGDIQFQTRAATLQAELDALEFTILRANQDIDGRGRELAALAALPVAELRQKVAELAVEAVGPYGMARYPEAGDDLPGPAEARGLSDAFERSLATAIDDDAHRESIATEYLKL
jgi:alkylation response protein AidB-like acyl-CoA dehydrogenase